MFQFEFPTLEDRKWMKPFLVNSGNMGSEAAFGTLYIWKDSYFSKVCRYKDHMLLASGGPYHSYNFPIGGTNPYEAVEDLIQDAKERGFPFKMWGVTKEGVQELENYYPGRFVFQLDRNGSDYIYRTEDLINLSGRKYHGKRNHLAQFNRAYDWNYEDITQDNLEDCRTVARQWCEANGGCEQWDSQMEGCALRKALDHFDELELAGGLIRIEGKPVAFTIGEEINPKTYLLHFEKALDGYNGLYVAINHEFAARHLAGYEYVNREEDMGIEGLRKAKLSYHPAILLEKYAVTLKEETKEVTE
ncbi:MAG: DUF2156 domain-containing protein [Ruminococcaceae bacterium]|nr:DUF2156 domain-containing protein [Oscillospiraceae bacterium]